MFYCLLTIYRYLFRIACTPASTPGCSGLTTYQTQLVTQGYMSGQQTIRSYSILSTVVFIILKILY